MKRRVLSLLILPILVGSSATFARDLVVQDLLNRVGIKPHGTQRGQMDVVGFASTAEQMNGVLKESRKLAAERGEVLDQRHGWNRETVFIAGICPHDDYTYAGRLYSLLIPRIRAKRVILFGVFHKAKLFEVQDKLVFDNYQTWHGPYGPVRVSPLREEILQRLPIGDYLVDNDMQMVEHSVEAIVPWLQAYNREVEIVSILVPYMNWDTMERLAGDLSKALSDVIRTENWRLGEDLALICSADAVHYGDSGWGGRDFAPFGTDATGYQMAINRDIRLAEDYLCGPITGEKLKGFLYRCVDPEDVSEYLITWCGRFSVPFGLMAASQLTETLEGRSLVGILLDYGSSVSEASLEVDGIGVTAQNNLHHWVGYAAIGYR